MQPYFRRESENLMSLLKQWRLASLVLIVVVLGLSSPARAVLERPPKCEAVVVETAESNKTAGSESSAGFSFWRKKVNSLSSGIFGVFYRDKSRQQEAVAELNHVLDESEATFTGRTRTTYAPIVTLSVGAALPPALINRFEKTRWLRPLAKLPKVFVSIGAGVGVHIQRSEKTGKRYLHIELIFEFESLERVKTFLFEVAANVNSTVIFDRKVDAQQDLLAHYLGAPVVLKRNSDSFSIATQTGLAIPPGTSLGMIYNSKTKRVRLPLFKIRWFGDSKKTTTTSEFDDQI